MRTPSAWKRPLYSALIFFGTLIALSVGYATWNTAMNKVSSGNPLSAAGWNALVDNIADLDSRWSRSGGNLVFTGGNVGIGTTSPQSTLNIVGNSVDAGGGELRMKNLAASHSDYGLTIGARGLSNNGFGIYDYTSALTRFYMDINGNVGIGTTSPWAVLTVTKNSNGWDNSVRLLDQNGNNEWNLHSDTSGNFMIGRVALTAFQINSTGDAWLVWTLHSTSDIRLKKEITSIESPLEKISSLSGVTYYWKDPARDSKRQIGVIAQDVEKVFPEAVATDEKGMKSVAYGNLVAPLIEAVKEQQKQIAALQVEVQALKNKQ